MTARPLALVGASVHIFGTIVSGAAAAIRRALVYLVTGAIFVFYSERVFWARWRPGEDDAGSVVATWLVYSIAAAACLILIRTYRVQAFWPMFLVGAVLGWLVEGVFTMTFFGAGGLPFPFTIAWTGLSWHALIAVSIGWHALHRAMRHSLSRTLAFSAGLGTFWGIWSNYWDSVSLPASADDFAAHAFYATLALILAFRAYPWLLSRPFHPGTIDRLAVGALALSWFGAVTLVQFNWIALVTLPPLFAIVAWALNINARVEQHPDFLDELTVRIPWSRSLALLLMPLIATLIHEACRSAGITAPTNLVVFFITLPLGFALFGFALRHAVTSPRAATPAAGP